MHRMAICQIKPLGQFSYTKQEGTAFLESFFTQCQQQARSPEALMTFAGESTAFAIKRL